jgi:hypothetical protein
MRLLFTAGAHRLALGLLLLGSCTKNQEEPAPTAVNQSPSQIETHSLQQLFLDRHYDQRLVQPMANGPVKSVWTWIPMWDKAIQKNRAGSVSYVYVPLEPRQNVEPHAVNLIGKKRYLRFERVGDQWIASVRSYFYSVPKGKLQVPAKESNAAAFLATFTGDVFTELLETGETTHSTYQHGVWQQPQHVTQAKGAVAASNCVTWYDCSWYLSCPPGWYGGGMTLGTSSQGYCEPPQGYTLDCGDYTQYQLQASYPRDVCESPGDDPGDNGGGSGSTGNTNGDDVVHSFTPSSTPESSDPDLPSDCASWQFAAVGPNGYMACGVTGIEIDLLSQHRLDDGTTGIGLNRYLANLYFEMPPRYAPGEAAMICAQIKDEVEELLENRYRYEYPPNIAQTINSTFVREMTNRITPYGGRITGTARYPNTPVAAYQHTFLPNNGGCY